MVTQWLVTLVGKSRDRQFLDLSVPSLFAPSSSSCHHDCMLVANEGQVSSQAAALCWAMPEAVVRGPSCCMTGTQTQRLPRRLSGAFAGLPSLASSQRLPREVVGSLSLEVFKSHGDVALRDVAVGTVWVGRWLD